MAPSPVGTYQGQQPFHIPTVSLPGHGEAILPDANLRLPALTPTSFPHFLVPLQGSWAPTTPLLMLPHLRGWVVASTRCQREPCERPWEPWPCGS